MKIKTIELHNYKAFYGKHKIAIGKKNVFIYGENGSGKSSLYYALKDFVQSSMENIDLNEVENIFLPDNKKGHCSIKVTLQPDPTGRRNSTKHYQVSHGNKDTNVDTNIKDAYPLKSFLTYKSLFDIHHITKSEEINLFNLLVKGVLKHFKYTLTQGKELGELWKEVQDLLAKETGSSYNTSRKKREVDAALNLFNDAFKQLFKEPTAAEPNREYILTHAKPILDEFNHNIDIKLSYVPARPNAEYTDTVRGNVKVDLKYAGKSILKPHLFLNEARLSAIAISIYLGMIKRHPQLKPFKILFLDDIFIGLDIANRLPLISILENEFSDYQIFISTYDKPWYEYAKSFLNGANWKTIEFYAQEVKGKFEIPKVEDLTDLLDKSVDHYNNSDYKASAVYARSGFEKIIMDYCDRKSKLLPFKKQQKRYSSENFWNAMNGDIQPVTKTNIEQYRFLIYNPLSHYDPEVNPVKTDLQNAIQAVRTLKSELDQIR